MVWVDLEMKVYLLRIDGSGGVMRKGVDPEMKGHLLGIDVGHIDVLQGDCMVRPTRAGGEWGGEVIRSGIGGWGSGVAWVDLKMKDEFPSGIEMREYPLEVDDGRVEGDT